MLLQRETAPAGVGRPPRRRVRWSFVIAGLAVAGAILYLVIANTGATAEYYMTISELRSCQTCRAQIVRVLGTVQANSVVRQSGSQIIQFVIIDQKQTMPVTYTGVVPDIFGAGIQVVVEGRLGSNGVFQAQTLLAKCPSKFTPATPNAGK
jgi:cytochrome c-type biogenesis protein CcmE